jgi:hypothetical protein
MSPNNSTAYIGQTALSGFYKGSNNKQGGEWHEFIDTTKRERDETNLAQHIAWRN